MLKCYPFVPDKNTRPKVGQICRLCRSGARSLWRCVASSTTHSLLGEPVIVYSLIKREYISVSPTWLRFEKLGTYHRRHFSPVKDGKKESVWVCEKTVMYSGHLPYRDWQPLVMTPTPGWPQ